MLDINKECPWCGMEIKKPKLTKGICEHCHNPYKCITFSYRSNRFTSDTVEKKETSGITWYLNLLLSFLASVALIVFSLYIILHRPLSILTALYLLTALTSIFLCCVTVKSKGEAFLKKWMDEEETKQLADATAYQKIALTSQIEDTCYHTPFLAEFQDPETGAVLPSVPVLLTEQPNLDMTMEHMQEPSIDLQKPGLFFQLYRENGEPVTQGITLNLYSGHPDIFQTKFTFSQENVRLEKKRIYIARMQLPEGEFPFYLMIDNDSMLLMGNHEVTLYHHKFPPKDLVLPANFQLYELDGIRIGEGTITYYYATRHLFESKKEVIY